jgi:PKD repeat protein
LYQGCSGSLPLAGHRAGGVTIGRSAPGRRLTVLFVAVLLVLLILPSGAEGFSPGKLHITAQKSEGVTTGILPHSAGIVPFFQGIFDNNIPAAGTQFGADRAPTAASGQMTVASLPFSFIQNTGQINDPTILFVVKNRDSTIYFTREEVILAATRGGEEQGTPDVIRQSFPGANRDLVISGEDELPGKANFFIGRDSTRWRSNVPMYDSILYHDLYPGINLRYYGKEGALKREFSVAPGADPALISVQYSGISSIRVEEDGSLNITTVNGMLHESAPVSYQDIMGRRINVMVKYIITGPDSVGLVTGRYNKAFPLVIDPKLDYSTYFGGTGNDGGLVGTTYGIIDERAAITVDTNGNAYVAGYTTSNNFRTTSGVINASASAAGNDKDAFVLKLNPAGSAPVWATYYGGTSDDRATAVVVDSDGNVVITGYTTSSDIPTTSGACNRTLIGANDIFVVKLTPDGSSQIFSTYYGGSKGDRAMAMAMDSAKNVYITGRTLSTNFLTTPGAYQTSSPSGAEDYDDVFIVKLKPDGSAPVYSTYYGGTNEVDEGLGIALDSDGNAYITGDTRSSDFPVTGGAFQTSRSGIRDAFVLKLNPSGSAAVFSTFFGGTRNDFGNSIAVDDTSRSVYFTGYTFSDSSGNNFPTTAGAANATMVGANTTSDIFVTKLNAAGSALVYSTYYGGTNYDYATAITIDSNGDAYVTGYTQSTNFRLTSGAVQTAHGGGDYDVFLLRLNSAGSAPVYSTYFGGTTDEWGFGIVLDTIGNAYVTGSTKSDNFPTTSNAANSTYIGSSGNSDAFIFKFFMNPPVSDFTANTTSGYTPQGIQFNDTSASIGIQYWNWSFGDTAWFNTTDSSLRNASHTYTGVSSYTVSLTITNTTTSDTKTRSSYINISAPRPIPAFTSNTTSGFIPQGISFNDTTASTNIQSWNWSFGDTTWFNTTDSAARNATHTYSSAGIFSVGLSITNSSGLAIPAINTNTTSRANFITILALPVPDFSGTPRSGDAALNVQFNDTSFSPGITKWNWSFGDTIWFNTTDSSLRNATHTYLAEGTYTVSLSLTNSSGTNTSSQSGYIIVGPPPPVPDFTGSPRSGDVPLTTQFNDTSLSHGITKWNWSFGDTTWFNTTDPLLKNTTHTYTSSGNFQVGLSLTNASGTNTTSRSAYITVNPPPSTTSSGSSSGGGISGGDSSGGGYAIASQKQHAQPASVSPGALVNVPPAPGVPSTPPPYYLTKTTIGITPTWIQLTSADKRSYILHRTEAEKAGYTVNLIGERVSASRPGFFLLINTENPQETGDGIISGTAREVIVVLHPDPAQVKIGNVDITAQASMLSMPEHTDISITISDLIPDQTMAGFRQAAAGNGQEISSVAYTATFRKDGLLDTGPGMIRMAAPTGWVDQNGGVAFVRIARIGDDRLTEILATEYTGTNEGGNLNFEAPTPHGLSIFGLVAVQCREPAFCDTTTRTASIPPNGTATWIPGIGPVTSGYLYFIAILLLGLVAAFLAIRRHSRKYDWLYLR